MTNCREPHAIFPVVVGARDWRKGRGVVPSYQDETVQIGDDATAWLT